MLKKILIIIILILPNITGTWSIECSNCESKSEKVNRCTGCERVQYCSQKCQIQDWKQHKITCGHFNFFGLDIYPKRKKYKISNYKFKRNKEQTIQQFLVSEIISNLYSLNKKAPGTNLIEVIDEFMASPNALKFMANTFSQSLNQNPEEHFLSCNFTEDDILRTRTLLHDFFRLEKTISSISNFNDFAVHTCKFIRNKMILPENEEKTIIINDSDLEQLACHQYAIYSLFHKSNYGTFLKSLKYNSFEILKMLKELNFNSVLLSDIKENDLVVYLGKINKTKNFKSTHISRYLGNGLIESKLGCMSKELTHHHLKDVPINYGQYIMIYRQARDF